MPSILLFSDVDGTLLDETGRYAVTREAIAAVRSEIDIVLTSSRTVLELSRNQRDLELQGPVVAENGALVALPWDDSLPPFGVREVIDRRAWCLLGVGAALDGVRTLVRAATSDPAIRALGPLEYNTSAGRRRSLLLRPVVQDSDAVLHHQLRAALSARGLDVSNGGQWLAVTRDADKGVGARALLGALQRMGRRYDTVAAVGDGDNDVALLLAAQRRFVMRRSDGSWHPALRGLPDVKCVQTPGIDGWRDVLSALAPVDHPTAMQEDR